MRINSNLKSRYKKDKLLIKDKHFMDLKKKIHKTLYKLIYKKLKNLILLLIIIVLQIQKINFIILILWKYLLNTSNNIIMITLLNKLIKKKKQIRQKLKDHLNSLENYYIYKH